MSDFEKEVLKTLGKRGKTKKEIATKLGLDFSYVSRTVNALVASGQAKVVGQTVPSIGRPADKYAKA